MARAVEWTGRLAILLGIAAASASPVTTGASALPQDSPAARSSEISGVVVDSVTGKPVSRALVISTDRRLATLTDTEGRFSLRLVPAAASSNNAGPPAAFGASLYLTAQRPGYLAFGEPVEVAPTTTAAPIQLKLVPGGRVAGTVFTEADTPAEGVNVLLLMHANVNGERRWAITGSVSSAPDGSFHFDDLRAGAYAVMTTEWAGDSPLPTPTASVTHQYPPTFFGDTATLDAANRVPVPAGGTLRADLHLRRAAYYPVTLPVAGDVANVFVEVLSPNGISGFSLGYNQRDHAVEGALPDGDYALMLHSFAPNQAFARTSVHVADGPVHGAAVTFITPAAITANVRTDWTDKPPDSPPMVSVMLRGNDPNLRSIGNATSQEHPDQIVLLGTAPGQYTVHIGSSYGYPASVRCGSAELTEEPLTVGPGGAACSLEITLRNDAGSLTGVVETSGQAISRGTVVTLLPPAANGQLLQSSVAADGSFAISDVPPGSYRAFATSPPLETTAWRDQGTMDALSGKGVSVTVAPKGTSRVTVPLEDLSLDPAEAP